MWLIFWKIVGFVVHLHGFLLGVMCLVLPVTLRPTNLKFTHVTANLATGKLQLETLIFGNSWLMIFVRFVVPGGYSKNMEFVSPTPAPKRAAKQYAGSKSKYLIVVAAVEGLALQGGLGQVLSTIACCLCDFFPTNPHRKTMCLARFPAIFITYHEKRRALRNLQAVIGGQFWQCDSLKTRNTTCPYCYARHAS